MTETAVPDLTPRHDDIEIMREALERPWLMPRLARAYSRQHLSGEQLPPFDLLPSDMNTWQLRRRWLHLKPETPLTRVLKTFIPDVRRKKRPPYRREYPKPLSEILKPSEGQTRSVIFVHNSYYHFFYLAQALRERGWNAWSVSLEDPDSANAPYYHGEDLNLWRADPVERTELIRELYEAIGEHFDMVHFHGDTFFSLFGETMCMNNERDGIGWDFLELKARGIKIGHSMSGCLTGQRKSVFNKVSHGVCNKCVWQDVPQVCSEAAQYHSGRRIELVCDLNALEVDWPADFSRRTDACFYDPLTYCVHDDLWSPDLAIPDRIERFKRKPGEVLVFHAVGNIKDRQSETRNIKGTPAVLRAIDRLRDEGYPVRLVFKTGVPSRDMRYYQIQADIVVDQIVYGRWGASARETLALGIPTIGRIDREQPEGVKPSRALQECPIVDASEETIYQVLKDLVEHPEKRERIGRESREYAVKWHSAKACAQRFERVYDRLMAGQFPLDVDEVYED